MSRGWSRVQGLMLSAQEIQILLLLFKVLLFFVHHWSLVHHVYLILPYIYVINHIPFISIIIHIFKSQVLFSEADAHANSVNISHVTEFTSSLCTIFSFSLYHQFFATFIYHKALQFSTGCKINFFFRNPQKQLFFFVHGNTLDVPQSSRILLLS